MALQSESQKNSSFDSSDFDYHRGETCRIGALQRYQPIPDIVNEIYQEQQLYRKDEN